MAGRPPKTLTLVKGHLTNEQKEIREKTEKSLVTSYPMKTWKKTRENVTAKKHFNKIKRAFAKIELDDICFEAVLNRYCIILGECEEVETTRSALFGGARYLAEHEEEYDPLTYAAELGRIADRISACDRALAKKRDMMLSIERENIMTVNAKLRAVPKKPADDDKDEMEKLLARGRPG
jgi:hypothetical protein